MVINSKLKSLWHGADYNPDQWLVYPDVLDKDIELMKKAGVNVVSLGIFAWATLEPEEGLFNFQWMDSIIDKLYENGIYVDLATPSGGMPAWLAEKYPEVCRMNEDGIRNRFGNRHCNCYSSPVYREKVRIINTKLAERYANHPAILMWHISNEYNVDDCHCPICRENFRKWLKEKYVTIDNLNHKWWNKFWSHMYNDFSQIDPPGEHGELSSNPLKLEWHRFKNAMLADFMECEIDTLRKVNPDIPVTTNFQQFWEVDYGMLAKMIDIVSWDSYPYWHCEDNEYKTASETALFHSLYNSLKKDKPYMVMECSPSATNWQKISKLRRPGVHHLASMQSIAHGSDTVMYFQWRKSRGQSEQFHGAVVGHDNSDNTRVFREVADVGKTLSNISEVAGTLTRNDVGILFDYDSFWSLRIAQVYRNQDADKGFIDTMHKNFGALWNLNIGCDFLMTDDDFSDYKVIIAPMLFMMKRGLKEKIESFVKNGGIFVSTFGSAVIDEWGLSFFDKEYYPLRNVLGIVVEETDSLYDGQFNAINMCGKTYKCEKYCQLAYTESAQVIGEYAEDFYAGTAAVTVNKYGKGRAYYIAADLMQDGYIEFYRQLFNDNSMLCKIIDSPENVNIAMRYSDDSQYVFVMNFNNESKKINLPFDYEMLNGSFDDGVIEPYGVAVLKKI